MNAATWSLLRRNRPFRRIVVSRLVSSAGTWIAYVALTIDVYARTHSSIWVSAVLLADFLPTIAVAGLVGPWLDRLSRRTLLVASELAAGVVFALLPLAPNAFAIVGLALVAGIASAVYFPSLRAVMPSVVDDAELPRANSLSQTVANVGLAAGPLTAGVLIAASGVGLAYALNALSFFVSAVLLARLPAAAGAAAGRQASGERHWHAVAEGLRVFADSASLRMVVRIWALASLGGAAINVGEVFLARQTFHAGNFGYCLLASATGTGLVVGSALAPRLLGAPPARACRLGLVAAAAGFAGAALAPSIWVAAACALVGTIGNAILVAAVTLLLQREVGEARLGHAFAIFDAVGVLATGTGMVAAGLALGALGARGTWLVAAALLTLAAVTAVVRRQAVSVAQPEVGLS